MAKVKAKRTKKYNPNKLQQLHAAQIGPLYEFEMQFVIEDVNHEIDAYRTMNNLDEDAYCPEWVTVQAYKEQDLIIALKMSQLKTPEYWECAIASHFLNHETNDVHTIHFYVELPEMPHIELMNGSKVTLNRGSGIKTRWKGLQTELMDFWKKEGVPEGYKLMQSDVHLKAQAKFLNYEMYKQHHTLLLHRSQGNLIRVLKCWGAIEEEVNRALSRIKVA